MIRAACLVAGMPAIVNFLENCTSIRANLSGADTFAAVEKPNLGSWAKPLFLLVVMGGIEPPTYGL
jgi:hypothetical protein